MAMRFGRITERSVTTSEFPSRIMKHFSALVLAKVPVRWSGWVSTSPSPRPSPLGRGRIIDGALTRLARRSGRKTDCGGSLSPRERAGGNDALCLRQLRVALQRLIGVLVLLSSLALLPGCGRYAPSESAKSSDAGPKAQSTQPKEITIPNQPATKATEMVQISGGKFMMGDKDEVDAPPHEVLVSSFLMDRNLVTQEQFQKVMGTNPSRWKGDKNPVEQLRWSDAVKFCNKRSELEGLQPCYDLKTLKCNFDANGYRLPTEAEWEYACRAGTTTAYFFGDSPAKVGDKVVKQLVQQEFTFRITSIIAGTGAAKKPES